MRVSLFPFSLPPPPPLFAPATQAMPSGTPNWHPKIPKCPPPASVGRNSRIESWILYAFRSLFSCEIKTKSYYVVLLTLHSQWYLETVCAKWLFLLREKQTFSRSEARLWVKLYRTMFVRRYVVVTSFVSSMMLHIPVKFYGEILG